MKHNLDRVEGLSQADLQAWKELYSEEEDNERMEQGALQEYPAEERRTQ